MTRREAIDKLWHDLLWKKFQLKYDDAWEIMSFVEGLINLPVWWDEEIKK